ncbi:MAG: hypothetical protein AAGH79_12485, partial [Bacteroidota bacterium]
MKRIVSGSIVLLLLSVFFFSCEKDEVLSDGFSPESKSINQAKSLSSKGDTKGSLKGSPAFELKAELAKGLSQAIKENPEVVSLLANQRSSKNKRFKALTLIDHLDQTVSGKGLTLAEMLLQTKSELPEKYFSARELKEQLLKTDPLVALKIPSVWLDYDFIGEKATPLVIAYENTGEQIAYANGRPYTMEADKNYFSINVITSEEHVITAIDDHLGDDTPFSNFFACEEVQNHVRDIIRDGQQTILGEFSPFLGSQPQSVVIDVIEDVRDVYTFNCLLPPSSPPASVSCGLPCPRDCESQDNRIMNFRPVNMAALLEMGTNAPAGQMEELFNFRLTTVTGNRLDNLAASFTQYFPFLLNEVVEAITTVTTGEEVCEEYWNSHWNEWEQECFIPTFSEVTVELRTIEFRDGAGIPLFGFNNLPQNTWSFDNYGTAILLDWAETDNTFYNNGASEGTQSQNSYSTQVSFNATWGIPNTGFGMSGGIMHGWQSSTTRTAQTNLTYSAAARTELGQMIIGYCDQPNTEGEELNHSTGSIEAQVSYFLWE